MEIESLENRKLALTNDGDLELFFVGVGSAFTKKMYQTNLLLIKGKDHLLIDCGTKCSQALYELGIPLMNISNFLITHSHADHIGGLEEAGLMGRYVTRKRPVMVITETYQNILWKMSLRGGTSYNEGKAGDFLTFDDIWDTVRPGLLSGYPRETFGVKIGDIDIKLVRTMHIPDSSRNWKSSFWSCAVIIDDRVFFTSDTRYDFSLIEQYENMFNFEAIFHDCQFFTGGVHSSLDELNQLPPELKKKTFLTHYGDNYEEFISRTDEYGFAGFAKQHVFYIFK